MIYSYIRVSTDKQTTANQKFEISEYAKQKNISIDKWIEETVSGTKKLNDRKLGNLLKRMRKNDILIISEMSRLGRNLMQIMSMLNFAMEREIKIIAIKENYELGDNINSKVLAFAFGLSAEIERNLISMRTKEALARKKAEGIYIGRPKGEEFLKLSGKKDDILELINNGVQKSKIAKIMGVSRSTLYNFIRRR